MKKELNSLFIDFKSAFDSVPHKILIEEKLPRFNIDKTIINSIDWLYS